MLALFLMLQYLRFCAESLHITYADMMLLTPSERLSQLTIDIHCSLQLSRLQLSIYVNRHIQNIDKISFPYHPIQRYNKIFSILKTSNILELLEEDGL